MEAKNCNEVTNKELNNVIPRVDKEEKKRVRRCIFTAPPRPYVVDGIEYQQDKAGIWRPITNVNC